MAAGRLAVVGGGLAGLSAGLELKKAGHEVTLFERTRLLGGKATSFHVDGFEVDNGQHVYLACCTEFVDFVEGLDDSAWNGRSPLSLQPRFDVLMLSRGRRAARLRAVPLWAPLHLAPALLGYRNISLVNRLRIGRAVLAARSQPRVDETFAAWLVRHGQNYETREAFWDPFLIPALNAPLENVSADDALFVIRTAFLVDAAAGRFGYSRIPLARIAESAARELDIVNLRKPVVALELDPANRLRGIRLEDGSIIPLDGVVLAIPPARLKKILGDPAALGVHGLDDFRTAPIVDVHLWYDVGSVGFDFAALIGSPVQWVFEKGAGYLCCSMSAADAYVSWSNADLVELCDRELRDMVPPLAGASLLRGSATRDRDATFVPTPGLHRPGPLTSNPRVVICGAWTDTGWPATMESAVRSGRAAARALIVQLQSNKAEVTT
jgi:squalene-associated FAD-dependent desaturase